LKLQSGSLQNWPTIAAITTEQQRRAAVRSLSEFVRQAWLVVEPGTDLIWSWHLDLICKHLEAVSHGELLRLLINIPPGHMKSLLVAVFWPAWMWTHTPSWRVLFSSYDMALSTRDSVRCRDVITSSWYLETFKPDWMMKGDQNVKGYFENTAGGLRQALSVGGKGTGFRGDCVVVDDPHNVKERASDEELAGVHFWWDKRMSSRLNDPRKGVRVVIQQRVHENDLAGHLLKKGDYTHLCLPTEFDHDKKCDTKWGEDPRTEPCELLFPKLFPAKVIEEAKDDLGEYDFAGQHNQTPAPPGGGIIKQAWFRFWYPSDVSKPNTYTTKLEDGTIHWHEQIELPSRFDAQIQSWDMTFKEKSKNPKKKPDFVVGQTWATMRKRRFLLDQVRGRMSFTMAVEAVRALTKTWPNTELKLVEDAANGPAITSELEAEIGGFELVTPAGGKEVRAHSASNTIRAGYVYLPHPDVFPWVKELLYEVCVFPRGANDDQLDALTQLINHTRESAFSVLEAMAR
jgi:predicted phage terminase large subunit-like protein